MSFHRAGVILVGLLAAWVWVVDLSLGWLPGEIGALVAGDVANDPVLEPVNQGTDGVVVGVEVRPRACGAYRYRGLFGAGAVLQDRSGTAVGEPREHLWHLGVF